MEECVEIHQDHLETMSGLTAGSLRRVQEQIPVLVVDGSWRAWLNACIRPNVLGFASIRRFRQSLYQKRTVLNVAVVSLPRRP
jgi:hypothetical protein